MALLCSTIVFTLSAGLTFALFLALLFGVLLWRRLQNERKQAQSRFYMEFALDHLEDGIVIMDADRKILFRNAKAMRLIPTSTYRSFEAGHDIFAIDGTPLPPDQWPSARALHGDFVHNYEIVYRRKDTGETGNREITTVPIPRSNGTVMISYRDGTPRRLLDQARMRLAQIVESSDDAIVATDTQGIVTSWNKAAEKTFGHTADEIIGQSIKILLPPDRHQEEDRILQRILLGEPIERFDTTRVRKDRRTIQVSLSISPIFDASGNVVGASKIARDITEARLLEQQIRQSQKLEAIGQLTGGIAHDFNNLLGIITGNLELLDQDIHPADNIPDDPARNLHSARCVHIAQRAAKRAAELTRRLLAFSANNEELKPAPTHLEHAIRNMLELGTRALGPEVTVTTVFDRTLLPVLVDPSALENALLNLMVNARDAMPKGGELRIATSAVNLEESSTTVRSHGLRAGRYACVAISDNGIGMSRETLEHAFEPFFTTKSRTQGTGLGLAMVYGFLKQSCGAASIHSEPGSGTTISLYLPFADSSAVMTNAKPVEQGATREGPHGGTLLLVDDEQDLIEIASTYLKRLGYKTLHAKDGTEALRVVTENPDIDLVVTDIIMPGGLNGVELVQKVRDINPSIRCIYTSGFPADALAHKSLEVRDCELIRKPYRLAELKEAIQRNMRDPPNS